LIGVFFYIHGGSRLLFFIIIVYLLNYSFVDAFRAHRWRDIGSFDFRKRGFQNTL
jgi:hypothetical protein